MNRWSVAGEEMGVGEYWVSFRISMVSYFKPLKLTCLNKSSSNNGTHQSTWISGSPYWLYHKAIFLISCFIAWLIAWFQNKECYQVTFLFAILCISCRSQSFIIWKKHQHLICIKQLQLSTNPVACNPFSRV